MKILLTGCNGLLGHHILKQADDFLPDVEIIATAKKRPYSGYKPFEYLDINDEVKLNYFLDVYNPDVLINTAAISKVDFCQQNKAECYRTNYEAVKNMADACYKKGIHLVHLSSDFVFDGKKGRYYEEDQPSPVNYYGECKKMAEAYLLNSPVTAAIVRTVLVYGHPPSPQKGNILTWVLDSAKHNKDIKVVNDQFRCPTLVYDLAGGVMKIALRKKDGIWHIAGNEMTSVFDFACRIATNAGYNTNFISPILSSELSAPALRPPKTCLNLNKSITELDYHPKSIDDGLDILRKETIA
ncbi:MAG: NAD(P)-dependent oxidoreductase [Bacteroidales bacterium]